MSVPAGNRAMDSPYEKHLRAALTSGGISTGAIYRLAFELCRDLDPGGTLLDLGAGTGNLIRQLIEEGHRGPITGADIQAKPNTLPAGVHWIQADLNEAIPVPDASFDTIVSTEVLLALENPRFVFRELFRVLRPGGTLIVTIPNQESIRSLVSLGLGGHFAAIRDNSYPMHITPLLHEDLRRMCREAGFAEPQFYYTNQGGLPKLPQVRWQHISLGLLKGRLFSDNLALRTRKP